ncbi:hypothetical protein D3C79_722570 [compost metagenome]
MFPELLGLFMGHGIVEPFYRPVMVTEAFADQRHDRRGDFVLGKARRERSAQPPWQGFAIVTIQVPGATHRAAIELQQKAATLAHAAVKVLHTQLATVFCPACESITRAKKPCIAMPYQW